jgi:hypothetical protein
MVRSSSSLKPGILSPKQIGHIDLSAGWSRVGFTFSLSMAATPWCHTPDVIDAKSRKVVATLKDEKGQAVQRLKVHRKSISVMAKSSTWEISSASDALTKPHSLLVSLSSQLNTCTPSPQASVVTSKSLCIDSARVMVSTTAPTPIGHLLRNSDVLVTRRGRRF